MFLIIGIIALENLWNQMQLHHNAGAMNKILEPDFVLNDCDRAVVRAYLWRGLSRRRP
jgi:hypothetical protein